jgi:protein KTI12
MPSLIVTGYPSAGKTTVSQILKERALKHAAIDDVIVINESSACPDLTQNQCYASSLVEKKTRAAVKAAFDRAVGISQNKRTLVIFDSLNYIKGFRYELHCLSKAAGERHGILWILNRASVVEDWNAQRPQEQAYTPEVLRELIQRYEPPDERNRWDKPLYTVDVAPPAGTTADDSKGEAVQKSVYNMHALGDTLVVVGDDKAKSDSSNNNPVKKKPTKSAFSRAKRKPDAAQVPTTEVTTPAATVVVAATPTEVSKTKSSKEDPKKETKPLEQQLDEILDSFLVKNQPLQQGSSTRQNIAGNANVLQSLDYVTQRLVSAISNAQTFHTGGPLLQIPWSATAAGAAAATSSIALSMNCPRPVALPELRRLRKQYLQWVRTHPPDDSTEPGIAASFLSYVEGQVS